MEAIKKEYKKLKKYSKSNLFTIQKLSGKKTIIDQLIDEYKEKVIVSQVTQLLAYIIHKVYNTCTFIHVSNPAGIDPCPS